ncbi:oligopeptide/dipeptide ABC transporter, ATPase subunit [Parafrankia sp. EAN1pec]|uniref:ABC transporter ATP-binding protein n=1 Tax=Parafrankia sp. (strain EAN1pec) TaxID=298653 RepID=UPI00005423ED|nr:oligopeptide/dipeptide ABC transporter, ATPase subunit [Frankia sp. EAN1pec]
MTNTDLADTDLADTGRATAGRATAGRADDGRSDDGVAGTGRAATGRAATGLADTGTVAVPQADLLRVEGLGLSFPRPGGGRRVRVLDDVDLSVRAGEIVGVIGETGSGKTTLARAIAGLGSPDAGRVLLDGQDISRLRGRARRDFRRSGALQFVFQDPLRALDPDLTIGASIAEGLVITGTGTRASRAEQVTDALRQVGLDPAVADRLPAQISGGQRQRASIARAVVGRPRLLLCDEPVSALDASNRNHILRLLDGLRRQLEVGIVLISHDLSSLAGIADRVVVLYRGRVVEDGPIADVFSRPQHPYTALLIASAPSVRRQDRLDPASLRPAAGADSDADGASLRSAGGCVFAHRCRFVTGACAETPPRRAVAGRPAGEWAAACHHVETWRDQVTGSTAILKESSA